MKQLASVLAASILVMPSAFADFRHSHETHGRDSGRSSERHDRSSGSQNWNRGHSDNRTFDRGRSESRTFDRGRDRTFTDRGSNNRSFNDRNVDRGRTERNFNNDRSFDRGRSFNDRSFDRGRAENFRDGRGFERGRGNNFRDGRGFDRGRPFFHEGRVERFERFGGGFRVWLFGAPFPFFIPEARFRLFPNFRVGLSIRLGGYYNPLGYYDYCDVPYDPYYYGGGYGSPAYVGGELHGIVESVDYRTGVVLVRDRASDRIVRVILRGDDPRFGDLRIGDYVDLSGDWTRIGTFDAYRVYADDDRGSRY